MTADEQLDNLCRMLDDSKDLEKTLIERAETNSEFQESLDFLNERTLILEALTGLEDENGM